MRDGEEQQRRRQRGVSAEEARLWREVTQAVTPLAGARTRQEPADDPAAEPSGPGNAEPVKTGNGKRHRAAPKGPVVQPTRKDPPPKPLAHFDRRKARQLASGRVGLEAVLDLHGMRQSEAHAALLRFLTNCQTRGFRYVKVITGKGTRRRPDEDVRALSSEESEPGVLRRAVPQWLAEPVFRAMVVSHTSAGRGHGGEGALYIQVRRKERGG